MQNQNLIPFNFKGSKVRSILKDGVHVFVAKDACEILELSNVSQALARLPENQKGICRIDTLGGAQDMAVVNEAGLYLLAFRSRKPEAEAFTAKVAEFIAEYRQTGGHVIPKTKAQALRLAAELEEKLEAAQAKIIEDAPKVALAESVVSSDSWMTMNQTAKALNLGIGEIKLFRILREEGVLFASGPSYNLPKQEYLDRKYFRVDTYPMDFNNKIHQQTKVSPSALAWIHQRVSRRLAA